jgi:hypothetical protein
LGTLPLHRRRDTVVHVAIGPMVPLTTAADPVAEGDLALARELVAEHLDGGQPGPRPPRRERSPRTLWVALALVVLASALLLGRLVLLTWH